MPFNIPIEIFYIALLLLALPKTNASKQRKIYCISLFLISTDPVRQTYIYFWIYLFGMIIIL